MKRINSLEINNIINRYRKINKNNIKLRHSDLLRKIKKISKLHTKGIYKSEYEDKRNNTRLCYELDIDGVKLLIDMTHTNDLEALQLIYENLGGDVKEIICIDRFETTFFNKLTDTFKAMGIKLETQKKVLDYRLDGYIPEYNIAIEYDEEQHLYEPQHSLDVKRQTELENKFKYEFVRLDYKNTDSYNIGLVINKILKR